MKPRYQQSRLAKPRSIRFTDAEWERIKKLAAQAEMSIRDFILKLI